MWKLRHGLGVRDHPMHDRSDMQLRPAVRGAPWHR